MINQLKNIKLTRKQRQLRFLVILIVFSTLAIRNVSIPVKANSAFLDNYEEIVVTIKTGDRAWNIQSELTPDIDVREALYHVNLINNKFTGSIKPGDEIIFLKNKDN